MELRLKITPKEGDPYEVETDLGVIVEWERKFKSKASNLANGIGMEDLAFLAYEASRSAGLTVPAVFDDYIKKKIRKIEVVAASDERPTDEAPTDAD